MKIFVNDIAVWEVEKYTFNDPHMGVRSITMDLEHPAHCIDDTMVTPDFKDSYVVYNGDRYYISSAKPTGEKSNSNINYKYNIIFNGKEAELGNRKIRNLALVGIDTFISQGTRFSIYADLTVFGQLLQNNLDSYFDEEWNVVIVGSAPEVRLDIDNMTILELLQKTYDYYGVRWRVIGNTIHLGYASSTVPFIFDYGKTGGLAKISRTLPNDGVYNRVIGSGGTRNVPVNYFSNRHPDFPLDPDPISPDVYIPNLMPKAFRDSVIAKEKPYKDYAEDAALVAEQGVRETALSPNDDIYPSIAGVTKPVIGRIDQIIAYEELDERTFNIWVKDIGFDLADDKYTTTAEAKISFTSGMVAGYEFVILAYNGVREVVVDTSRTHNGVSSKYKITLIKSEEDAKIGRPYIPYDGLEPNAGDSFVIYDIEMPYEYVLNAEERLQGWLDNQLAELKVEKPSYVIEPYDSFLNGKDGILDELISGNKIVISNDILIPDTLELYISRVSVEYGRSIVPKYTIVVSDKVEVDGSSISKLSSKIDGIENRQYFSLQEIKELVNSLNLSKFRNEIRRNYLSKINPDIAQEIITFAKGIISQATIQTTELTATGNIASLNTIQGQIIKAIVTAEIQNMILKGTLSSESFNSGLMGDGFRLTNIGGSWTLEVDKIVVRQSMEIYELIVQKLKYQGGQIMYSPFGGKITDVSDKGTYWECKHDSPDDAIAGALILCQNFKVGSANQNPTGDATFQGVSVKRYWRKVTSVGRGYFNLSKSVAEAGSGTPQVGDEVVVLGHESNPDWQNAIILASTGGNTPYVAHYAGINTFSLSGKEVVREGNLSGIVDAVFGSLSGYGLYSNNAYLRGVFKLANGEDIGTTIGQLQTEVSAIPGQIDLAVKSVPLGLTNLLRNYNADLGLDFWSVDFDTWEQGGFSGYNPQSSMKKIRTGFIEIEQGKYNIELSDDYKVQVLFYNASQVGVQNNQNKINGDSVTAGSTVKYARFAIERADGEDFSPADYKDATFRLTMGTIISDAGDIILPHIVSITLPQSTYSVQKDGTLTPQTAITLNLSNGTIRQATINWGSINTSSVGSFTHSSNNYTIPSGVALTPKPNASITVNVTAGAPELTITSVVELSQVTVERYGTPVMPSMVTLNISDGSTRTVAVTWGAYNTNTIGVYTISGSYDLPLGVTGSKPAVSVSLNVVAQAVTVVSVTQPNPVNVVQNGVPTLPSTVTLNLSDSTSQNVAVSWSYYSTSVVGTYTLTGTYNLPAGVSGNKPAVSITLNVTAASSGDIIDLKPLLASMNGVVSGTDAGGSYITNNGNFGSSVQVFDNILGDITTSSVLYIKVGALSQWTVLAFTAHRSGSYQVVGQWYNTPGGSFSNSALGSFREDGALARIMIENFTSSVKIYELAIANNGAVPNWF